MTDKTPGQIVFEAYRDQLDGVRPWSEVREAERRVWEATGTAVREDCAQLAEQDAAHADLQVASDEARIVGEVLRNFAERLRR